MANLDFSSKKFFLAAIAKKTGVLDFVRTVRSELFKELRVVAYHRVLAGNSNSIFPFDAQLISAWEHDFEWQTAYMSREFDVITLQDLTDAIDGKRKLPKRPLLLTFDDGYLDNYEVVFPILKRHKVPATFFLTTSYIGSDSIFWFDAIAYAVGATLVKSLELPYTNGQTIDVPALSKTSNREKTCQTVLDFLKKLPNSKRISALTNISEQLGVQFDARHRALSQPLNWDQVREMSAAGMEFGSHTVSHPILSSLSNFDELMSELLDSKREIESQIGKVATALAYPVGSWESVTPTVRKAVHESGYKLAFAYEVGLNRLNSLDHLRMQRLRAERYLTRNMFEAMLTAPNLFAYRTKN